VLEVFWSKRHEWFRPRRELQGHRQPWENPHGGLGLVLDGEVVKTESSEPSTENPRPSAIRSIAPVRQALRSTKLLMISSHRDGGGRFLIRAEPAAKKLIASCPPPWNVCQRRCRLPASHRIQATVPSFPPHLPASTPMSLG
jgi:hypothetical protein